MAAAILLAAAVAGCGKVGDAPKAQVDSAATPVTQPTGGATYVIDTTKSKVGWIGAKITRRHEGGFHKFSGVVTADGDQVTGVQVDVDPSTIYTDEEKLIEHLKSPDFFDVAKFPKAAFEASRFVRVDSVPGATHMVTGNLTMHGVTHGVTFPATIKVDGNTVTARADFKISRKDWGVVYPGQPDDLISDDVRIIFDIVASKAG
jgi:polyisoprenoid-binding protein YceI